MAYEVEYRDITGNTDGFLLLTHTPLVPEEVIVDPVGGPAQVYGADFIVIGNALWWDHPSTPSSDITSVLQEAPVELRIGYER